MSGWRLANRGHDRSVSRCCRNTEHTSIIGPSSEPPRRSARSRISVGGGGMGALNERPAYQDRSLVMCVQCESHSTPAKLFLLYECDHVSRKSR